MAPGRPERRGIQRRGLASSDRAGSAVLGAILLVAIVLVLAGTTVFLGDSLAPAFDDADRAAFTFDFDPDGNGDNLVIAHDGGQRLDGDQVTVVVEGAIPLTAEGTYRWAGSTLAGDQTIASGNSVRLAPETIGDGTRLDLDAVSITVRKRSPSTDQTFILARWSGPNHDSGTNNYTSADGVSVVDQSETIGGDTRLYFHINASREVTVSEFAVTTVSDGDMGDVETIGSPGNDVVVETTGGNSEGSADEGGSGFATDGTRYTMDTNATVPRDGRANVSISQFLDEDGKTYTFGDGDPEFRSRAGPWDVAVTLGFRDGSSVTYYVDVPEQ